MAHQLPDWEGTPPVSRSLRERLGLSSLSKYLKPSTKAPASSQQESPVVTDRAQGLQQPTASTTTADPAQNNLTKASTESKSRSEEKDVEIAAAAGLASIADSTIQAPSKQSSGILARIRSMCGGRICGIGTRWWIALVLVMVGIGLAVGLAKGLKSTASSGSDSTTPTTGTIYTGDFTYYEPGLGSCGIESSDSSKICAVSHILYDAASTDGNPNDNPLCGKKIKAWRGDSSVVVTVVDRCTGCAERDLDFSPDMFEELATIDEGRVTGSWEWVE